ncbi:hypothetical protein PtrEW4_010634, partial [Pyrenophora tritici-repentis]
MNTRIMLLGSELAGLQNVKEVATARTGLAVRLKSGYLAQQDYTDDWLVSPENLPEVDFPVYNLNGPHMPFEPQPPQDELGMITALTSNHPVSNQEWQYFFLNPSIPGMVGQDFMSNFGETENPPMLKCSLESCQHPCSDTHELEAHERSVHPNLPRCDECSKLVRSNYELNYHVGNSGHIPYACKKDGCASKFTQSAGLTRHMRKHQVDAKRFPCKYCKKYRGKNGFKRRDHLAQHVRNYHHIEDDGGSQGWQLICEKEGCSKSKPASANSPETELFKFSGKRNKHIRTVHDHSYYQCPQPGCNRVNGKGYFVASALKAHL